MMTKTMLLTPRHKSIAKLFDQILAKSVLGVLVAKSGNGLLLSVEIHATNEHDSSVGFRVIEALNCRFESMKKVYADGGYRGELAEKEKSKFGWDMEITLRSDTATDFKPLPVRWVVERTFSWLENFRRLAKDYEYKITASTAMIQLAFIALMLNIFFSL
jgi:putative transposase